MSLLSLCLNQRTDSHHTACLSTTLLNHQGTNSTPPPPDHLAPLLSFLSFPLSFLFPTFDAISHSLAFSPLLSASSL